MVHLLWMFVVGIVAGGLARLLMPGNEHMGILMTGILGIIGSFVGGAISRIFSKPADGSNFHAAGFVMSVIGALVALIAWHQLH